MNSKIKEMAKIAKRRMTHGSSDLQQTEEAMYRIVAELLASGQPVANPIGILLQNTPAAQDAALREKIVFETAELYLRLKQRYENQNSASGT